MDITSIVTGLIIVSLLFLLIKYFKKSKEYETKYSKIIDIEEETEKNKSELEKLKNEYKLKKAIYDKLVQKVAIFDDEVELAEFGFYKPVFDFDTSEKFKEQIEIVKNKQKELIKTDRAIRRSNYYFLY